MPGHGNRIELDYDVLPPHNLIRVPFLCRFLARALVGVCACFRLRPFPSGSLLAACHGGGGGGLVCVWDPHAASLLTTLIPPVHSPAPALRSFFSRAGSSSFGGLGDLCGSGGGGISAAPFSFVAFASAGHEARAGVVAGTAAAAGLDRHGALAGGPSAAASARAATAAAALRAGAEATALAAATISSSGGGGGPSGGGAVLVVATSTSVGATDLVRASVGSGGGWTWVCPGGVTAVAALPSGAAPLAVVAAPAVPRAPGDGGGFEVRMASIAVAFNEPSSTAGAGLASAVAGDGAAGGAETEDEEKDDGDASSSAAEKSGGAPSSSSSSACVALFSVGSPAPVHVFRLGCGFGGVRSLQWVVGSGGEALGVAALGEGLALRVLSLAPKGALAAAATTAAAASASSAWSLAAASATEASAARVTTEAPVVPDMSAAAGGGGKRLRGLNPGLATALPHANVSSWGVNGGGNPTLKRVKFDQALDAKDAKGKHGQTSSSSQGPQGPAQGFLGRVPSARLPGPHALFAAFATHAATQAAPPVAAAAAAAAKAPKATKAAAAAAPAAAPVAAPAAAPAAAAAAAPVVAPAAAASAEPLAVGDLGGWLSFFKSKL